MPRVADEPRRHGEPGQPQRPPDPPDHGHHGERHRHRRHAQHRGDLPLRDRVGWRDVERSSGRPQKDRQRRPRDVLVMHELQRRVSAVGQQHHGDAEKVVAEEVPHPLSADDRRTRHAHGDLRVGGGKPLNHFLHDSLVGRVVVAGQWPQRRRLDAARRVVRPGTVDRRAAGHQQPPGAGGHRRGQHAPRAIEVVGLQSPGVTARLHRVGQMHDRIGAKRLDRGRRLRVADIAQHHVVGSIADGRPSIDPEHAGGRQRPPDLANQRPPVESGASRDRDPRKRSARGFSHRITSLPSPRRRSRRSSAR